MADGLLGYPEYKDSGVEWLGAIPAHWQLKRAKYVFRESDVRSIAGHEELLSVSHITGVTPRSQKNVTMFKAESYAGSKICEPSDLVINTMWAWMGALGVSQYSGIVSPSYGVYRATDKKSFLSDYLDRLLRTPLYIADYVRRSTGIRSSRLRLYPEQFLEIPLVQPTIDDQKAIVRFLDVADQRIQQYIRAKQKLVKLLNEQKQAIIQQAVTRGLDPTVPMKESGVEWLGVIPAYWDVTTLHLRYLAELGKMLDEKKISGGYLVPYLRNVDVRWGYVNTDDLPQMDIKPDEYDRFLLKPGDMLICEGGAGVGRTGFWEGHFPVCAYQKALHRVRVRDSVRDNPRYLFYLMYLITNLGVVVADGSVSKIPHLTNEKLRALRLPFPPKDEQDAIVAKLDSASERIDEAIGRIGEQIGRIREYRTRLISDVVTGKVDVRDAAFALPSEMDEGEAIDASADDLVEFSDEDAEIEEMTDAE